MTSISPACRQNPENITGAFVRFAAEHAGNSILDLGCGYGAYSLALARRGRRCVGCDVNMKYLVKAAGSGLPVVAVDSVSAVCRIVRLIP